MPQTNVTPRPKSIMQKYKKRNKISHGPRIGIKQVSNAVPEQGEPKKKTKKWFQICRNKKQKVKRNPRSGKCMCNKIYMKYIDTCNTVGDRKGLHCDIGYIISNGKTVE